MNVRLQARSLEVSLLHKHAAKIQLNVSRVVSDYTEMNLEICYECGFILRFIMLFEISKHRLSIASYSGWSFVELTKASDTIHAERRKSFIIARRSNCLETQ
jgi:hypothetical protein